MKEKVEILEKTVIELTNKIADLGLVVSERYEQLDKVVPALVRKVLSLESEEKDLKNKTVKEKDCTFDMNDPKVLGFKVDLESFKASDIKIACNLLRLTQG